MLYNILMIKFEHGKSYFITECTFYLKLPATSRYAQMEILIHPQSYYFMYEERLSIDQVTSHLISLNTEKRF